MRNYLYMVKDVKNKIIYREYRYEQALEYFHQNREADKLYAYTKDLKPVKLLILWK